MKDTIGPLFVWFHLPHFNILSDSNFEPRGRYAGISLLRSFDDILRTFKNKKKLIIPFMGFI